MRRVVILATLVVLLVVPSVQAASRDSLEKKYTKLYERVDKANAGPYEGGLPGRNLVEDGRADHHKVAIADLRDSMGVMRRMLHPAPVVQETTTTTTTTTSYSSATSSNSVAQCESGGDYTTNTGNGYSGAYQFDDATWQAAGGSTQSAYQASPAEQDAVFNSWYAQHPEAWPNCG